MLRLFFFCLTVCFIPWFPGAGTVTRWVLMSLWVPWLFTLDLKRLSYGHVIYALFLLWCAATFTWTADPWLGVKYFWQFVLFGALFCIGADADNPAGVFKALALGMLVNAVVVVLQHYGWDTGGQSKPPGGLFFNKDVGADFAAMVLVGCIGYRVWWGLPGLLVGLFYQNSKAALLGLFIVGVFYFLHLFPRWRWRWATMSVAALILVAGAYHYSGYSTSVQRYAIWLDTIDGLTFWGRGIGSLFTTFGQYASRYSPLYARVNHPHNDLLQIWYEMGVPGVVLAVAFTYQVLKGTQLTDKLVFVVFLVEGCFGFPLYVPATMALAAFAAGRLCRDRVVVWRELPVRRLFVRQSLS